MSPRYDLCNMSSEESKGRSTSGNAPLATLIAREGDADVSEEDTSRGNESSLAFCGDQVDGMRLRAMIRLVCSMENDAATEAMPGKVSALSARATRVAY